MSTIYLTSPATTPEKSLTLDGDSRGGRIITRGSFVSVSAFYLTSPATAPEKSLMSTDASILVDSVGPPSAEVCRTAASFP